MSQLPGSPPAELQIIYWL